MKKLLSVILVSMSLAIPAVAVATPPALSTLVLDYPGTQAQCITRGQGALTGAGFTGVTVLSADTTFGATGDYTGAVICTTRNSVVLTVMGPQSQPCVAFVTLMRDRITAP